jgi:hypothetical protein
MTTKEQIAKALSDDSAGYISYFTNRNRESLFFHYDEEAKQASLIGAETNWEPKHITNAFMQTGTLGDPTASSWKVWGINDWFYISQEEYFWLKACFVACGVPNEKP